MSNLFEITDTCVTIDATVRELRTLYTIVVRHTFAIRVLYALLSETSDKATIIAEIENQLSTLSMYCDASPFGLIVRGYINDIRRLLAEEH